MSKDYLVIATAKNWVAAVVHQGIRVMELQEQSLNYPSDERIFEWAREQRMKPDFTHIEDHFFVTAVSKSVEWLVEAHKTGILDPDITEQFMLAADKGRLVRNIREHFIEYLNGGGRQKSENRVDIGINDNSATATIDASSVIVTNEGRLIGGRLNVEHLMREAEALFPALLRLEHEIVLGSK
jgi:hypothetical protein